MSFAKEQASTSSTYYSANYDQPPASPPSPYAQQPPPPPQPPQCFKPQEPNIDFELDVKVLINSGKCVLHTKDSVREEELKVSARMRKERSSSSAGIPDWSSPASPGPSRPLFPSTRSGNQANLSSNNSSRHGMNANQSSYSTSQPTPPTVFHIPAMDIRVHYTSTTNNPLEKYVNTS